MSKPDHFVSERQALIYAQLQQHGRVLSQELAQTFDVSEDTVRRDLREMAARGECTRVYGGALLATRTTVPLKTRMTEMPDRKATLGRTAARFLQDGMTVFIDAGSTNLAIAKNLGAGLKLTVITSTPVIAAELEGNTDIDLILIGGRVHPAIGAAIDATAIRQLEQMRPDLCIVGVCGLTVDGLCAEIYEDATFKRLACEASARTLAAITSEKLGVPSAFHVSSLSSTLTLVLEEGADLTMVGALASTGVKIHQAGSSSDSLFHTHAPKDQSR
ncbi:DeoR/GlpR family transcriptional regulator of sugar metabolism [Rhizobium skierniewicense]|uniref:DeoR/GlpR family transcriptional regulator of sugar metabolism n=1 Tax=Rhizobium skierniewicense TaxID=984260 RepID=A0A7W6C602_9HYPH|nr:DeoR/GlpR family DNA-binding transcription regulator [Rhizobium skierniewicense]MBB3946392.1 DeoR/GlpR family transcriptional regulator of sugar metabolism [Rhizobium skierniewicense]